MTAVERKRGSILGVCHGHSVRVILTKSAGVIASREVAYLREDGYVTMEKQEGELEN